MTEWLRLNDLRNNFITTTNENSQELRNVANVIANMQVGDKLEGTILLNEQQALLKLANGLNLPVSLPSQVDIGKSLTFMVIGKEEQKLILQTTGQTSPPQEDMITRALNHLQLPNRPEIKAIINQFIGKQLPLSKEAVLEVYQTHKNYEIPAEAVVNLKASEQALEQDLFKAFSHFKLEGMEAITQHFDKVIDSLTKPEQLMSVFKELSQTLKPEQLNKLLEELVRKSQSNTEEPQSTNGLLKMLKTTGDLEHIQNLNVSKETMKGLGTTEENSVLERLEKAIALLEPEESMRLIKGLGKSIFKNQLQVNLNQMMEEENESQKLTQTHERLEKLTESLRKVVSSEMAKESIVELEKQVQVLSKFNMDAQYYCFPMIFNEKETTGELYFFKPKKNQKQSKDEMYIVIALNLPALHKIEVHIEQNKDDVNLTMKVESETIKKQIEAYTDKLHETLKQNGYGLNSIKVQLLKDSVTHPHKEVLRSGLYHMDLKA